MKNLEDKSKEFFFSFVVDLGLIPDEILYHSGLLYNITSLQNISKGRNITKERVIIASGGRYDNLLAHYAFPSNISQIEPGSTCGIGSQIFIEKIFLILLQGNFEYWVKGPLIFVSGKYKDQKSTKIKVQENTMIDREKISLVLEMWKNGYSTIYNYNDMTDEEIIDSCRRYRIRFWISLKLKQVHEEWTLKAKIKDFAKETAKKTADRGGVLVFIQERLKSNPGDVPMTYPQSSMPVD